QALAILKEELVPGVSPDAGAKAVNPAHERCLETGLIGHQLEQERLVAADTGVHVAQENLTARVLPLENLHEELRSHRIFSLEQTLIDVLCKTPSTLQGVQGQELSGFGELQVL